MNTVGRCHSWCLAVLAALLAAACDVKVQDGARGGEKDVDIRTPLGDLSVRTSADAPDTGLPVYPGARPMADEQDESASADVRLGFGGFGLQVAAAKFASEDSADAIARFYKEKLQAYGEVTECRGEVDFKGDEGLGRPVCKEQAGAREIQLAAGTERNHRLVAVEPRGSGAEFAVIHIRMQDGG